MSGIGKYRRKELGYLESSLEKIGNVSKARR
jgi:hypothetical protein